MNINDLTYIEVATEEVFGGRGADTKTTYNLVANVNKSIKETVTFKVDAVANVKGLTAVATATSDSYGFKDASVTTLSNTQIDKAGYSASAISQSVAAANTSYRH
ncbi:hypothetical protein NIES22_20900 [Calothrix brevissima NIES-22]|nr:hypothetical protein NIES22_20900 [Calothrix brevissima NIES-22]